MREYIVIFYENSTDKDNLRFPYFEIGKMYKNLEPEKAYTLKELGLEEN